MWRIHFLTLSHLNKKTCYQHKKRTVRVHIYLLRHCLTHLKLFYLLYILALTQLHYRLIWLNCHYFHQPSVVLLHGSITPSAHETFTHVLLCSFRFALVGVHHVKIIRFLFALKLVRPIALAIVLRNIQYWFYLVLSHFPWIIFLHLFEGEVLSFVTYTLDLTLLQI